MADAEREDGHGNLLSDLEDGVMTYCVFPDCGCNGARLCQAKSGANNRSLTANVEGMYSRKDRPAIVARMRLLAMCLDDEHERRKV